MHHGRPAREEDATVVPLRSRGVPEIAVAAVDLDDLNSPHTLAVLSIPPGATVLDVGCGPGVVSRALAARGCKVYGLELDPRRAMSARHYCVEVLEADVEAVTLSAAFPGLTFDAVLFLDVLEHLRDPRSALAKAATVLAPGGRVLLSIPNVAHGALRLELLSGRFRYQPSGLLDRGHLRFFDAQAVDELIADAGFRAESRLRVTRRLDQTEFAVDVANIPDEIRRTLERDTDALTYQFFVIAAPASVETVTGNTTTLVERQQARIDELTAAVESGAGYTRHLQEELAAKDTRLREIEGAAASVERARFEELAAAIENGGAYAAHLREELTTTTARLQAVEGAFAGAERELNSRAARMDDLEGAFSEAERQLELKTAHLQEIETAFAGVERELSARAARIDELERTFGEAQRQLDLKTAHLQKVERAFAGAERELSARAARIDELERTFLEAQRQLDLKTARLEDVEGAFANAMREVAALTASAGEKDQLLADLGRLSEDSASYVRHLEGELRRRAGEIAIRDDDISVLRVHVQKVERTLASRDREMGDRDAALGELRAHIEVVERALADRDALRERLDEVEACMADREARLEAALRQAARHGERSDLLATLLEQPRHRLAERGNSTLKRWAPLLHRLLRPVVATPPAPDLNPQGARPDRGAD
jgi:O-antigen biosynthesis protein